MDLAHIPLSQREKARAPLITGSVVDSEARFSDDDQTAYEASEDGQHHQRRRRGQPPLHSSNMGHCLIYALAIWGCISLCGQTYHHIQPRHSRVTSTPSLPEGIDVYQPSTFPDPAINLCDSGNDTTIAPS